MSTHEKFNDHHNIARSHGGSNHACNLIHIHKRDHTNFHRIFEHLTPDQFLRILTLYGVREGMPPTMSQRLLKKLMEQDIYDPKALVALSPTSQNETSNGVGGQKLLKADHCVQMCLSHAQKVRENLQGTLYRSTGDRAQDNLRKYLRTQVTDITDGLGKYSSLLPEISRETGELHVTKSSVATHTAYQLLKEASLTTEVIASLLGNGEPHHIQRKRKMSQRLFKGETGAETIRNALSERNRQGHYQYVAPLLPSVRHETFDCARGQMEDWNAVNVRRTIGNLVHHFEALILKVSEDIQPVILPRRTPELVTKI